MTPAEAYLEVKAHKHREDAYYGFWAAATAASVNSGASRPKKALKPEDLYRPHLVPRKAPSEAAEPMGDEELRRRMQEVARRNSPNRS